MVDYEKTRELFIDRSCGGRYSFIIDLLLAELCLPRDWHRALSEFLFQNQSVVNGGVKTGHGAEQKSATVAPA